MCHLKDLYMFVQYIRANRCYIAFASEERSGFILFCLKRSSYRVLEWHVAWNISLRDNMYANHALATLLLAFLKVLNFIFGSLGTALPVRRVATSGEYFFCDFALAPVVRSSYGGKKREKRSAPIVLFVAATFLRDNNASAIDNRRDIISE